MVVGARMSGPRESDGHVTVSCDLVHSTKQPTNPQVAHKFPPIRSQIEVSWVNNGEAGDLRHHHAHYDITVMIGLCRYSDITMSAMASNNWNLNCLPNHLFRRISMKTSKLHITGYFEGNPLVTGGFPSLRASNVENVSIKWRYHDTRPLAKNKLSYKTMID